MHTFKSNLIQKHTIKIQKTGNQVKNEMHKLHQIHGYTEAVHLHHILFKGNLKGNMTKGFPVKQNFIFE